eukprot:TRINITY_DN18226_c0_g1_i1.p1 TRINITY_DN18226_c0_g1~~TRINITY_DN18226_c0_g1_i1.p1  ORF type:complete len:141 (-),score=13.46 TRINITY_DN18226_c0_g1_i1:194-616(-)
MDELQVDVAALDGKVHSCHVKAESDTRNLRIQLASILKLRPPAVQLIHGDSCLTDEVGLAQFASGEPPVVHLTLCVDERADTIERIREHHLGKGSQVSAQATDMGDWVIIKRIVDYDTSDEFSFSLFHIPSWKPTVKPLV